MIPIWEGTQLAAALPTVTGVEETLDVAYIFRYWLIGKSAFRNTLRRCAARGASLEYAGLAHATPGVA